MQVCYRLIGCVALYSQGPVCFSLCVCSCVLAAGSWPVSIQVCVLGLKGERADGPCFCLSVYGCDCLAFSNISLAKDLCLAEQKQLER